MLTLASVFASVPEARSFTDLARWGSGGAAVLALASGASLALGRREERRRDRALLALWGLEFRCLCCGARVGDACRECPCPRLFSDTLAGELCEPLASALSRCLTLASLALFAAALCVLGDAPLRVLGLGGALLVAARVPYGARRFARSLRESREGLLASYAAPWRAPWGAASTVVRARESAEGLRVEAATWLAELPLESSLALPEPAPGEPFYEGLVYLLAEGDRLGFGPLVCAGVLRWEWSEERAAKLDGAGVLPRGASSERAGAGRLVRWQEGSFALTYGLSEWLARWDLRKSCRAELEVLRAVGGAPNGKVLSTLAWVLASNLEARARVESKSALRPQSEVHERVARHALAEALWSA